MLPSLALNAHREAIGEIALRHRVTNVRVFGSVLPLSPGPSPASVRGEENKFTVVYSGGCLDPQSIAR